MSKINMLFSFLRFISIFSVLLLLINPKFEQVKLSVEKPNLIIAVDNSNSILHLNQNTITITQGTKPTKYTTMFVFDINMLIREPITVIVNDPSVSPNPIDFSQAPTFAYRAVTPLVPSPNVV